MDRGTYVASSAGMLQFRKLDVVNNNLANINTPGFKRQVLVGETQTFDQTLASLVAGNDPYARGDHDRMPGTVNIRSVTDYSPGPIKNTGNNLDVALRNAKDFFVIDTPQGQQYTRAGNFTLNEAGDLVAMDGFSVLGDGGAINAQGPGVNISPNGSVVSNGEIVGQIQVVRFEDMENLERVGANRFVLRQGTAAPEAVEADLVPQSLEMSNVSAISSVIDLMTANRAFDLYAKSSQAIDQLNQTAITQVGRRSQ